MIVQISNTFSENKVLKKKIDYHISKIESGVGEYLYDSFFGNDIELLHNEMVEVGELNDRVDKKYVEFSINFPPGETVENSKIVDISREYLNRMGYENACYAIIKHTDKEHLHCHILCTTVDYNGVHISDSHSKIKSQQISRDLEVKFDLKSTEYSIFKSESLRAIKQREYYYSNALNKALKNYGCKSELEHLISDHLVDIQGRTFTNDFYEVLFGMDLYQRIGQVLEKNNMFSRLYKEELLHTLDELYRISNSKAEFLIKVQDSGIYVRLLRNKKDALCYTYGVGDVGKYFKENSLPSKYRYAELDRFKKQVSINETRAIIAKAAVVSLKESKTLVDFVDKMKTFGIVVITHENTNGVYGLSFQLPDSEQVIKGSEITSDRSFSYPNLVKHFNGEETKLKRYMGKEKNISFGVYSKIEQIEAISTIIKESLIKVSSHNELHDFFVSNGVSFWRNKNDRNRGYSFKIIGNVHASPIKGSDIGTGIIDQFQAHVKNLWKKDAELRIRRFYGFSGRMEKDEQLDYIYHICLKNMNDSSDFNIFTDTMKSDGILVKERKRADKVVGYNFLLLREDAVPISSKSISEVENLMFVNFAPDSIKSDPISIESPTYQQDFSNSIQSQNFEDNEPLSKKKKKRKRNNNISFDY